MKSNCEEKMTGEIKRMLRYLDEACTEQGILMEEAVGWFRTTNGALENAKKDENPYKKQDSCYRERAQYFAGLYVKGQQKEICTEVLCFMHEQEECPKVGEILTAVTSKIKIASRNPHFVGDRVFMALEDMCKEFYGNDNYFASGWVDLKNTIFRFSKSL